MCGLRLRKRNGFSRAKGGGGGGVREKEREGKGRVRDIKYPSLQDARKVSRSRKIVPFEKVRDSAVGR